MSVQIEVREILNNEMMRLKRRNPSFSLRGFAKKIGIQPSALSEILSGKRDVTRKMAAGIFDRLCLDPKRSQVFLNQLQNKRTATAVVVAERQFVQLNMDHYHVVSNWQYFAILSLAETEDFIDSPEWVAQRLNISINVARIALRRLERLALLERDGHGKLAPSGIQFKTSTDVANASLRKSHYQNLDLAKVSLDEDSVDARDFSAMTMAINPAKLPEGKKMIREFRRKFSAVMESGEKKEVYRICLQLFPLSRKGKSK
jgi:uncharacterized protein (TIGR02147 family)